MKEIYKKNKADVIELGELLGNSIFTISEESHLYKFKDNYILGYPMEIDGNKTIISKKLYDYLIEKNAISKI